MATQKMKMTVLKEDVYMTAENEEARHTEYYTQEIKISKGTKVGVHIKKHEDGRAYYTYFCFGFEGCGYKNVNEKIFINVSMRKNGKLYKNCGMVHSSTRTELAEFLNNQNK